jgi:hypothetical protein
MACFVSLTDRAEVPCRCRSHLARMVIWGGSTHISLVAAAIARLGGRYYHGSSVQCALAHGLGRRCTLEDYLILKPLNRSSKTFAGQIPRSAVAEC